MNLSDKKKPGSCGVVAKVGTTGALVSVILLIIAAQPAAGQQPISRYAVDYSASYLLAVTGKTGMFSFAAHNHAIIAKDWTASINFNPADLAHSSVDIKAPTASLVIDSNEARQVAQLGPGPSPADVRAIQEKMLSSEVLDAAHDPVMRFTSTKVDLSGEGRLILTGDFELHGKQQRVKLPAQYSVRSDQAVFDSEFTIRQKDYGITPVSIAGGMVKVKNSVAIRIHLVMRLSQ